MRAEGIAFGNGIDSSLHSHPFIEAYFNLRAFKKIYSKERLDKYRKENLCPVIYTSFLSFVLFVVKRTDFSCLPAA
jgi:hypothetical protein